MTDLREALAAQAHESWSGWMRYLFSKCDMSGSSGAFIPGWAVERWQRQMNTPYAELPEEEKESDRKEADEYLALIQAHSDRMQAENARLAEALQDIRRNADKFITCEEGECKDCDLLRAIVARADVEQEAS